MMANQHFGVQPIAHTTSLSVFPSFLPDPPSPGCFPGIATPTHCEVVGRDGRHQLHKVFLTKMAFVVILDGVAVVGLVGGGCCKIRRRFLGLKVNK